MISVLLSKVSIMGWVKVARASKVIGKGGEGHGTFSIGVVENVIPKERSR